MGECTPHTHSLSPSAIVFLFFPLVGRPAPFSLNGRAGPLLHCVSVSVLPVLSSPMFGLERVVRWLLKGWFRLERKDVRR